MQKLVPKGINIFIIELFWYIITLLQSVAWTALLWGALALIADFAFEIFNPPQNTLHAILILQNFDFFTFSEAHLGYWQHDKQQNRTAISQLTSKHKPFARKM